METCINCERRDEIQHHIVSSKYPLLCRLKKKKILYPYHQTCEDWFERTGALADEFKGTKKSSVMYPENRDFIENSKKWRDL